VKPALKENNPHNSLWRVYRETQDSLSQEKLVIKYMHLVEKMANQISLSIPSRLVPKEDLMGMGYIGLIEAIKKFDYKKWNQFETFGLWRIRGAMLDGLRQLDWVPRSVREKTKKLNNALAIMEQSLMRTPTIEELSQFLDTSSEEINQSLEALSVSTLLSLNGQFYENDGTEKQQNRLDKIIDESQVDHERQLQMNEFKKIAAECIELMTEKERLVVSLFYYEGLTQVEIAEVLDLTKGRISQLHTQAIIKMRKAFQNKGFSMDSFL